MEALTVSSLSFNYPGQSTPALKSVSLRVEPGSFFVLCGTSGSGKTTLLRLLKPAIAPGGRKSGTVLYRGTPVEELDELTAASSLGFVSQSPEHQTVTDKVWHELAFGLESLGLPQSVIRRRTAETAAFFGIEDWFYKDVSELSGGQKQLLVLASVMATQPEVLILDEPTAQLDPIAASEFLSAVARINRELGTTVILSEHRLEEALPLADRAAVMENGEIISEGTPSEIGTELLKKESPMFSAMPAAVKIWGLTGSDLPCPVTVNEGRLFFEREARRRELRPVPRRTVPIPGEPAIKLKGVSFRYSKEQPDVLRDLELTVRKGELYCLLGGNGSGKTTALRVIAGLKTHYAGKVETSGTVAMLPQEPQTLFIKKTVRADLEHALMSKNLSAPEKEKSVCAVAELCGLSGLLERHPYDLSGGEQQKAALAKLLLLSPDILLLDEPTKGLDASFKAELAAILKELISSGKTIVMVSHDVDFCAANAHRCGLFFDGAVVSEDSPEEFFGGNSFYTTAANRIARGYADKAITPEDAAAVLGAEIPSASDIVPTAIPGPVTAKESTPEQVSPVNHRQTVSKKLFGTIPALFAAALFLFASVGGGLGTITDKLSLSPGIVKITVYGAVILLTLLSAALLSDGVRNDKKQSNTGVKSSAPLRTKISAALILLLVPLTLFVGVFCLGSKQYYLTSLAVIIECSAPFFLIFEGRRPKARELTLIAVLCALGVAGRAAFFMLPQFKPVMALVIIAGACMGAESGFLVGAVSMLVSNFIFSQGPWTPWQMFAMGMVGFLAGVFFRRGFIRPGRLSLCVFGAVSAILIYGGIVNPSSAFIWGGEALNLKMILSYYVSGFPMDIIQAASTAVFLWLLSEPMLSKLERIKEKYEI